MIKLCRVDERLLHGQVAVTWVNVVNPDAIIIANDEVMKDELARLALKMAKPEGMKMAIRSIDQAVTMIKDQQTKDLEIFLLVKNIHDAKRISDLTGDIHHLNLGRCYTKNGTVELVTNMLISESDANDLMSMYDDVEKIEYQMVPSDSKKDVKQILVKGRNV